MTTPNICPPTDIDTMVVGSFYGMRQRGSRQLFHAGVDFCGTDLAPTGRPVYAIADGIVRYTWNEVWPGNRMNATSGYGNCVLIEHPGLGNGPRGTPWCSFYAHLQDFRVKVGDRVTCGQQIGRVGATRNGEFPTMGAHLHFEIRNLKRATYANQPPDLLPGNNNTLYGVSGDTFYRPSNAVSAFGTTMNPATFFAMRGVYIADGSGGVRRGTITIDRTRAKVGTPDPRYAPAALPPASGFAFSPVLGSPSELSRARGRLASAARRGGGAMAGLGLAVEPAYDPAAFERIVTTLATGGTATQPHVPGLVEPGSPALPVTPDQVAASAPSTTAPSPGNDSENPEGGRVNLIIPEIDPEVIGPPTTAAYAILGASVAATALAAVAIARAPRDTR